MVDLAVRVGVQIGPEKRHTIDAMHAAVQEKHTKLAKILFRWEGASYMDAFLSKVTETGNEELFQWFIACDTYSTEDLTIAAAGAARGGHLHLLRQIIAAGAQRDSERYLFNAAFSGCMPIFEFLSREGVNLSYPGVIAEYAAGHGHLSVLQWCYDRGWRDFNNALAAACSGGHLQAAHVCHGWGATAFDESMRKSARNGHETIVRLCHQWGATDLNGTMAYAAEGGHEHIMRFCQSLGAANFNQALKYASCWGQVKAAQLCRSWGATDIEGAFLQAAVNGSIETLRLCRGWGAVNTTGALREAMRCCRRGVIEQCLEWGVANAHRHFEREHWLFEQYEAYLDRSVASIDEILSWQ
jgi:hypothetical protein